VATILFFGVGCGYDFTDGQKEIGGNGVISSGTAVSVLPENTVVSERRARSGLALRQQAGEKEVWHRLPITHPVRNGPARGSHHGF